MKKKNGMDRMRLNMDRMRVMERAFSSKRIFFSMIAAVAEKNAEISAMRYHSIL